ncbi:MAG: dipeptidase [Bacillota bacterium]
MSQDGRLSRGIFDAHADTLAFCIHAPEKFQQREGAQLTLPMLEESEVSYQVLAVCVDRIFKPAMAVHKTLQMIAGYWEIIGSYYPRVYPVLSRRDLAPRKGVGLILALEGAEGLGGDPMLLQVYFKLGVRMLSLTWNDRNEFADGAHESAQQSRLTGAGREVIQQANLLGVVVDVSHLNESCFWDVIFLSRAPVAASHANAASLCRHPRNLTDAQLKAVAETGGVVGVNFYPSFLGGEEVSAGRVLSHLLYMHDLIGENHVGLGSDFDGMEKTPRDLCSAKDWGELRRAVAGSGLTARQQRLILGENWLRLFREVLPENSD